MNTPQKTKKFQMTFVTPKDESMEKEKSKSSNSYEQSNNGMASSPNSYNETPVSTMKHRKHGYDNRMDSCRRALFLDNVRPEPK